MSGKMKIIVSLALLGFIAGVAANFTYKTVIPALMKAFPQFIEFGAEWFFSGFAGAILTILMVVAWAYISGPNK